MNEIFVVLILDHSQLARILILVTYRAEASKSRVTNKKALWSIKTDGIGI